MDDLSQVQPFTFYTALHLTFVLVSSAYQGHISSCFHSQSTNSIPVYQLYLPATSRVDFLYPLKILLSYLLYFIHVVLLPCHIFLISVQYVWEDDQLIFTATRLLCVYI